MLDELDGRRLMVWCVRAAVAFYLMRTFVTLRRRGQPRIPSRAEVLLWTAGCVFYVAHVTLAFSYVHQWSHQHAFEHTASETARLTGISRGEGLWINYVFTVIWVIDVVRIIAARSKGQTTSSSIDRGIQVFFAFIVFNATIVFGPAIYAYLAIPTGLALLWAACSKPEP